MNFNSKVIHSIGEDKLTGAVNIPIYQTSTFKQEGIGVHRGYEYSRTKNPTRYAFEQLICELEEGVSGFAFSSGMAAINTVLMLFQKGDHIILSSDLYGGTYRLISNVFTQFDIEVTYVDLVSYKNLKDAIKINTKAIFFETPTNPLLRMYDISKIASIAKDFGILTIVDNTLQTPYHSKPITLGANIVIHSATKYLSGHSDVVAGVVVVDSKILSEKTGFLQNAVGAVLGPQDSWLLIRGIKTLGIRMERHQHNATLIAEYLNNSPFVKKVYFAGVGGMITIEVFNTNVVDLFLKNTKLFTLAESLGAVESLVSIPSKMTHSSIPEEKRLKLGITDCLIRFSIGIEDVNDLIEDLDITFGG